MLDIGEALAQDQLADYRDAHAARERGETSPRLAWGAAVSLLIIASAVGALLAQGLFT
ncbi:hypothetical protein [Streptomyces sp. NPDC051567]|uniref:hypothetical protein n=1 Tax=Streptomyces sp. NPDC051567 TaxID=3365660 RepID=UPI0037925CCC